MNDPSSGSSKISVLYVDDEPSLLDIGKIFLERFGDFKVTTCENAVDALKLLKQKQFDAVISDYQMPECDGLSFLRHFRERGDNTPFIIFTGKGREDVVIEALNSGADFYLQKGGNPKPQFAELANKIRYAVSKKKSEEALIKSEEKYFSLFNNAILGIFRTTPKGVYLDINPAFARIYGYNTPKEMIDDIHNIRDQLYVNPEVRDTFRHILDTKGEVKNFIAENRHRDGHSIWISINATAIKDDSSEEIYYEGTIEEITQQRASMEALERRIIALTRPFESNGEISFEDLFSRDEIQRLQDEFAEATGVASVIIRPDGTPVTKASKSTRLCSEILRKTEKGVENCNKSNSVTGRPDKNGPTISQCPCGLMSAGAGITVNNRHIASWIIGQVRNENYSEDKIREYAQEIGADGEKAVIAYREIASVPEEQFRKIAQVIYTLSKKLSDLAFQNVSQARTIRDLKAARTELSASEEKLRSLFENLKEIYYILDENGTVIEISPNIESVTGYPPSEYTGRPYYEFVHPDDRKERKDRFREILSGKIRPTEFRLLRRDGSSVWVRTEARPAIKDGHLSGIQGIFTEIEDLKMMEEKLKHHSRTLAAVNEMISAANRAKDLPSLFENIIDRTLSLLDFDAGGIYIIDEESGTASVVCSRNVPQFLLEEAGKITADREPYYSLFMKGETIITDHYEEISPEHAERSGFSSMASVPLVSKGRVIGALNVAGKKRHEITDEERETLISAGESLGSTIERFTAEDKLRKSEEQYRAIYDNSTIAIELFDSAGRLIHVNPACLEIFGVSDIEDIKGFPLFEDPNVTDEHKEKLLRGETVRYEVEFDFDTVISLNLYPTIKSGSAWLDVLITPLKTDDGTVTGYLVHVQDITDKKVVEDTIKKSEEKYRSLAENSPVGILTCDREGTITYVNQRVAEILGSPGIEKTAEINLLHTKNLIVSGFADILRDVIDTGKPVLKTEMKYISVWGREVYLRIHIIPLQTGRNTRGAMIIIDDITERKRTEKALLISNKKLQLLSGITRHDILNHVMVIGGYLDLAGNKEMGEKLKGYCNNIRIANDAIKRQIEFTREYDELGAKEPDWYSPCPSADKNGRGPVNITCECEDIEIFADPMIEKVFYNLYDNTIRHSRGADEIRISCGPKGGKTGETGHPDCLIIFEDNGCGVLDEMKERIFERGVGENTGLGLFLIREILAITGITIRENGVHGKGARFEMTVPAGAWRIQEGPDIDNQP
ncbi:PAS domain S-box protein [Methanoplanus limicola]|uniref:histidine kinase n=1 Tax=Methanoplanus limicola DSM 2279 TaxID=937775 RepID=H1Z0S2_9EURY|nr:PAS domain S-box protein [Methanoplanus limicola]EHQ36215.1 multi-sensor signal transduction histidine kinase [Methanoplanus limicola DSM 2279]